MKAEQAITKSLSVPVAEASSLRDILKHGLNPMLRLLGALSTFPQTLFESSPSGWHELPNRFFDDWTSAVSADWFVSHVPCSRSRVILPDNNFFGIRWQDTGMFVSYTADRSGDC